VLACCFAELHEEQPPLTSTYQPLELIADARDFSVALPLAYTDEVLTRRLAALRDQLRTAQLDALIVSHPQNRRYLSGYLGFDLPPLDTAGWLLIHANEDSTPTLLTDFRYLEEARHELSGAWQIKLRTDKRMSDGLVELLAGLPAVKRLGFESAHLLHLYYAQLGELLPGTELVATQGVVEAQRYCKDAAELQLMRRVIALSDAAFDRVAPTIRPGMTERQIAWEIEKAMRDFGADGPSFQTIVAAGPNGAQPHAIPSEREVQTGEPLVIDMGALYAGYCSDMTRTICLGEVSEKFATIHQIVAEAQRLAEAGCHAGMTGEAVDAIARDYITQQGYGDFFGHGLGHGTGLEVHEPPSVRRRSQDILAPGVINSIEPGIYLPDWGGVRIEDLVLVRDKDCEVLTLASRQSLIPL